MELFENRYWFVAVVDRDIHGSVKKMYYVISTPLSDNKPSIVLLVFYASVNAVIS
jgi:hypothetical protein